MQAEQIKSDVDFICELISQYSPLLSMKKLSITEPCFYEAKTVRQLRLNSCVDITLVIF